MSIFWVKFHYFFQCFSHSFTFSFVFLELGFTLDRSILRRVNQGPLWFWVYLLMWEVCAIFGGQFYLLELIENNSFFWRNWWNDLIFVWVLEVLLLALVIRHELVLIIYLFRDISLLGLINLVWIQDLKGSRPLFDEVFSNGLCHSFLRFFLLKEFLK